MILQISRIQVRRGLKEDLPQLASAEFGWAIDTRQLYIGNGTSEEGAPTLGNTEILTQFSDIFSLSGVYTFKGREAGFTVQTGPSTLAPVARAMQDKFDDLANIRDFGAIGDGVMHDSSGNGTEGDGLLEVVAFNRAITEIYKATVVGTNTRARRTIHIPAGTYLIYGDFIRLMPYVKLTGDGKNATFLVQASAAQPCLISSCDSKLHTGFSYSFPNEVPIDSTDLVDILPGYAEVEDLTLVNVNDKDIAYLHTVTDILFTRVGFVGPDQLLPVAPGSNPMPPSCVRMASSQFNSLESESLMFRGCEFSGKTYGFYADSKVTNVKFDGCKFDRLYRGINLGQSNDGAPMPASIKVTNSVFDNIYAEGIYAEAGLYNGVSHVVSAFNTYKNVGNSYTITSAQPVLSLGGNNCYSIGDLFVRPFNDPNPTVQLFGKSSFATLPNGRTLLGKQFTVGGEEVRLLDNTAIDTVAGAIGLKDFPTIIEYSIIRGTDQRVGTLHITPLGATVNYSDDYVETNDIGVTLTPVFNTGVVELMYKATLGYQDAMLKTSSRTLIGSVSPPPLPHPPVIIPPSTSLITRPSPPTNVSVTLTPGVIPDPTVPSNIVASIWAPALPHSPTSPSNVVATFI